MIHARIDEPIGNLAARERLQLEKLGMLEKVILPDSMGFLATTLFQLFQHLR